VLGGIPLLDILQGLLFVDINKDVALDSLENVGALDLARLEHDIAVREDDRPAPLAETFQHVESAGVEPVGEWVIKQEVGRPACNRQTHAGFLRADLQAL
jgi:hypothetical protein